jgi:Cu(I)/Ag(I) efflux system membrane protein CusA/SilA
MIERIIESSIRNRFLVLIVAAGLAVWGIYSVLHTPVDAIPDLSENQVIVFTDWMGRGPEEINDQVTYPLSLKLQGLAGVKAIRSASEFNFSMITIIFEDNVDFYFARERVVEKLQLAATFLPKDVVPYLAPDATALGQIFWYTVEPRPGKSVNPGRVWALNKYQIAPELNAAAGVSDVATVGGAPKEYQIDVRPERLRDKGVTLGDLYRAVAQSNVAVGGGVVQKNNAEYIVRGVGYLRGTRDIENTVIREVNGTPIYIKDVAMVHEGQQVRRSVYEKDGSEVSGGVVMMRYGENPLAVTRRVKEKIQGLEPVLEHEGVRIVPAYDRTHLIQGAIDTLTGVMWHEMLIASIAVFLILWHFRSAFVICVTLPLSVLFSFLLMWLLRQLHVIDIQANIMSLAGITISIGILVDQAIVMTENATHHLKEHFGDRKVTGDIRSLVIPACRTVGRPIFFSVIIMLISFIPVFALSGREGKLFHPLAFTKSFALVGVALISVTVVPALIPTFLKGRLKREEDNWIVRSFINIYKPVLTWALPRRNLVMWAFAVLLILAAGFFPLQAVLGMGASETGWQFVFLLVTAVVIFLTVAFTEGSRWQVLSFVSLVLLALWAYHFPKIGVEFMPALDEGSVLDMPSSVTRTSITQAANDLKARDALLRGFPEVESVIGKAGRADTPTDPAPLEMIETFVNFRPRELWPKRVLKFPDAGRQARAVLAALEARGYVMHAPYEEDRDELISDVAMRALERFDDFMRQLAAERYHGFETGVRDDERGRDLGPALVRFALEDILHHFQDAGALQWPAGADPEAETEKLARELIPEFGPLLARNPALEDVTRLTQQVARRLQERHALQDPITALALNESWLPSLVTQAAELLGAEPKTFAGEVYRRVADRRLALWHEFVRKTNWELFDRGTEAYTWFLLEEFVEGSRNKGLLNGAGHGSEYADFGLHARRARDKRDHDPGALQPFYPIRQELEEPFRRWAFFWQRQGGKRGDLVDDEMSRVVQVPGWGNVFTQPIINRVEMLSTNVRTDIGVKVFGPKLETIDRVCKDVERALKDVNGARDVLTVQAMGKGYVEVRVNREQREKAARYGISVADIMAAVETALGGRVATQTVEGRDRFPVRIRYARAAREDEESVRRVLVSAGSMASADGMASGGMASGGRQTPDGASGSHAIAPLHLTKRRHPLQIPLGEIADVRVVEGPAEIKSENGKLVNYVTLMVRGRDMVGFVEEAQRVVAEKVRLPEGVHLEWSGEFEHQVRAARTLRFVWPAVFVLIFVLLYLTYKDLADAALMMLAVPEALAGGAFFQFLFPKIVHGWSAPPLDFSVAVWVGYIACFGMAAETGIIMLVYLREAIEKRGGLENIASLEELRQAVIEGAVHRLRPKLLTEGVAILAIAPMLWATGVGAEVIAPMAAPVLGGLLISDEVVDIFLPVRFYWVRRARWLKLQEERAAGRV